MSSNTADLILAAIATIAVTAWLAGYRYLANSPAIAARRDGAAHDGSWGEAGPTTIVGEGEIAGDRLDLSTRLAAKVARDGLWQGGPIEIVEGRDGLLAFVSPGDPANPRGEVRFESAGPGRTRYAYRVEYRAAGRFLLIGWIVEGVGLVVLAAMYGAMHLWVARSPQPSIRVQCFQLIQVVHVLWPPFMLGHRYRSQYRMVRDRMDSLLRNLPHLAA